MTTVDRLMPPASAGEPPTDWGSSGSRDWWVALGAAGALLVLTYGPNLLELGRVWSQDENYTHGFLVIPIAAYILWQRMVEIPWTEPREVGRSAWWGWGLLVLVLVARTLAYEWSYQWVETATLIPAITCLAWAFGGWQLLYRAAPAILFLVFMLPLPKQINDSVTLPLQQLAATGSYILLQISGFWVVQQGNVLSLTTPFGPSPLDVAQACSGLKMLMTLAATVTATVMLFPMPIWKRVVVLLSAVPIALASNMARIVVTGWCYYYIEGEKGHHWAHDIAGWMMMPLALILVALELGLLAWLVPEATEAEREQEQVIVPLLNMPRKDSGGPKGGGA
ncbi:MAG: exosortase/archaeosortase family protein [Isosphaeraceae bacterium]